MIDPTPAGAIHVYRPSLAALEAQARLAAAAADAHRAVDDALRGALASPAE